MLDSHENFMTFYSGLITIIVIFLIIIVEIESQCSVEIEQEDAKSCRFCGEDLEKFK